MCDEVVARVTWIAQKEGCGMQLQTTLLKNTLLEAQSFEYEVIHLKAAVENEQSKLIGTGRGGMSPSEAQF